MKGKFYIAYVNRWISGSPVKEFIGTYDECREIIDNDEDLKVLDMERVRTKEFSWELAAQLRKTDELVIYKQFSNKIRELW